MPRERYDAIRGKLEVMQKYLGPTELKDPRLRLTLEEPLLKIKERGTIKSARGTIKENTETLNLRFYAGSMKAYTFVGMVYAFYEAGDIVDTVITRNDLKDKIISDILNDTGAWTNAGPVNSLIKNLVMRYDVFGKLRKRTVQRYDYATDSSGCVEVEDKDSGNIKLGYKLKGNLQIAINKLPDY